MGAKQVWFKDGVLQTYDNGWKPVGPAPEPVAVTGVSLDESSLTLGIDETKKLTATIIPSNATDKKVTWSSSNEAVATVSSNGTVRGIGAGSATITVTTHDGNFTATCGVTVSGGGTGVQSVKFTNWDDGATLTTYVGQGEGTGIQVVPYTASNINVTVTTSDENVISLGEVQYEQEPSEHVIGWINWSYIGTGTATITLASVDNPSATSTITVTVEPKVDVESISNISGLSFNVFPQTSIYEAIKFEYSPSNATNPSQDIIFSLKDGETDIGSGQIGGGGGNGAINFFTSSDAQVGDSAVYELYLAGQYESATEITVTVAKPVETVTNLDTTTMQVIEGTPATRSFDYTPIDAPVEDFFWADAGSNAQATVHKITDGQAYIEVVGLIEGSGTVTLKNRAGQGNYGQFDYVVESPSLAVLTFTPWDETNNQEGGGTVSPTTASAPVGSVLLVNASDSTDAEIRTGNPNEHPDAQKLMSITETADTGYIEDGWYVYNESTQEWDYHYTEFLPITGNMQVRYYFKLNQ